MGYHGEIRLSSLLFRGGSAASFLIEESNRRPLIVLNRSLLESAVPRQETVLDAADNIEQVVSNQHTEQQQQMRKAVAL